MRIKVQPSPDDPTLPTSVREDIIHISQSGNDDNNYRGPLKRAFRVLDTHLAKIGIDTTTFLFSLGLILIMGVIVLASEGGGGGGSESDDIIVIINQNDGITSQDGLDEDLYTKSLSVDAVSGDNSEDVR